MKLWKRMGATALVGALALSMVACGGGNAATSGTSTAASSSGAAAATGSNVLNVMTGGEVASLDPQLATDGTSFEVIADFTDGLMQMDTDGQPVPAIAESYEVSEDGCTYTFHLREDATWSNGDPVTANDFVFAWQRAADPATASEYSYMMSDIGQIKNAAEIIAGLY